MHVGIIGGGMMGLATATHLARHGVRTTIIEKESSIGGLSCQAEIVPGVKWDKYYHVILSTDTELIGFLDKVGLAGEIDFRETQTGFFSEGRLHSMSNVLEFLRFKPINLLDKIRLGLGILFASRIEKGRQLEKVYANSWLIRVFGRRNYEKLWDPLMRSKFGTERHDASALLIWATIKRYYQTRSGSSKKELMGYVPRGYHSILRRIETALVADGEHRILTGCSVERLESIADGRVRVHCTSQKPLDFDRVVATIPNPAISRLWPEMPSEYRRRLASVRYLGLVCATLLLKRSLTPYYVTNLTDPGFPFTGVIEMTNIIPKSEVNGYSLVYLPRYLPPGDSFIKADDEYIFKTFFSALKKMFPFITHRDLAAWTINKEAHVQPLLDIQYSKKIAPMQTPMRNFYVANTSMILDSNLNNNRVVQLSRQMADLIAAS